MNLSVPEIESLVGFHGVYIVDALIDVGRPKEHDLVSGCFFLDVVGEPGLCFVPLDCFVLPLLRILVAGKKFVRLVFLAVAEPVNFNPLMTERCESCCRC